MIKDIVSNMGSHTQAGHPRHAGPAQVVQAPAGYTGQLIENAFGLPEVLERLGSKE
jgi:hypothetical protein